MITLAIDTSTSQGGVALLEGESVLARFIWSRGRSHGELLTPHIERALKETDLTLQSIERVAVGRGPGSFTGIRIGVNAARSLAYTLSLPVVAFDSTEILAAGVTRTDLPLITLLNAQMNLLFASTFVFDPSTKVWKRSRPLEAISLETLREWLSEPHLCLGDGYLDYQPLLDLGLRQTLVRDSSCSDYPLPEVLGRLAARASNDQTMDWNQLQPLYIRASGAEEKLRGVSGPTR